MQCDGDATIKAQCDIWLVETGSIIIVQQNFPRVYGGNALLDKTIYQWLRQKQEVDLTPLDIFFSENMLKILFTLRKFKM